jgi:glutamate dehydrogenase/leucine dehydrogenase
MKSCTGKPSDMGGLPHELGSTGIGVGHAAMVAIEHLGLEPKDLTFAVEGFGNVGWFVSKYLTEKGLKLIAVSDSKGTLVNKEGINFEKLAEIKKNEKTVTKYEGEVLPNEDIIKTGADILITAAIPDLIKDEDVNSVNARMIICGSNIPFSLEAEEELDKKGILVVPDFVANAGGVISSYVEYIGGTEEDMWKLVEEKLTNNTKLVLDRAKQKDISPRKAGMEIAKERVMNP